MVNLNEANIKVVGVGNGGCNAVSRMAEQNLANIEFIAVDTDEQSLLNCSAKRKIYIQDRLNMRSCTSNDYDFGRKAAERNRYKFEQALNKADIVFIIACMGGNTGTSVASVFAETAREIGALTVAIVTKPFNFESKIRANMAESGINALRERVDNIIVFPDDKAIAIAGGNLSPDTVFSMVDNCLAQIFKVISYFVFNFFEDIKIAMRNGGLGFMGIGAAKKHEENKAVQAAKRAISNLPLVGAKSVLLGVISNYEINLSEVNRIGRVIQEFGNPYADIVFRTHIDKNFNNITVFLFGTFNG